MSDFSLRRQNRLRREYLYRKSIEDQHAKTEINREKIKNNVELGSKVSGDLKDKAIQLMEAGEWDDKGPKLAAEMDGENPDIDDEYRWAGLTNPKVLLTTSRDPSIKLIQFTKEMKLIFPTCERINRGSWNRARLIEFCRANDVTDFVEITEISGVPNELIISHLPFGPTAYFTIQDVVMRHDIVDIDNMSEQFPHLIFNNFQTQLAKRTMNVLKYLFPVPKDNSTRLMSFTNWNDWILFRHHVFKKAGPKHELKEVGPRFSLKLHKLIRGAVDQEAAADIEFVIRPQMNTAHKRLYFSDDQPWDENDD